MKLPDVCKQCGMPLSPSSVLVDKQFGAFAYFLLFMGISATPSRITCRCLKCRQTVYTSAHPADLAQYRGG